MAQNRYIPGKIYWATFGTQTWEGIYTYYQYSLNLQKSHFGFFLQTVTFAQGRGPRGKIG